MLLAVLGLVPPTITIETKAFFEVVGLFLLEELAILSQMHRSGQRRGGNRWSRGGGRG